jgi:hypothetical protein
MDRVPNRRLLTALGQIQAFGRGREDGRFESRRRIPNVEDWLRHLSQETYRRRVATEQRQKRPFWQRMERAGLQRRG